MEPPAPEQKHLESAGRAPWWVGSSNPIVLRVPRGLALLALAGMVGLLVLSYYVGYAQGGGHAAGAGRGAPNVTKRQAADISASQLDSSGGDGNRTSQAKQAGGSGSKQVRDVRKNGLNYLRLATYPLDSAKQLQAFLAQRGVHAVLDRVSTGYAIVATNVGVAHIGSPRAVAFKSRCRQLGREWARHLNNKYENLGSMEYEKYKGKD